MSSLDQLVSWIHDRHCKFRLSDDVVLDIEELVVDLVNVQLPELIKHYPGCRYSVAEVINAGSYFEKTKIKLPNEFDFMLVVEQLSSEQAITIMKGCRDGYARVRVIDSELWDRTKEDDSPERLFELALLQFNMYVRETLKLALSEPLVGRFGELSMKDVVARGKPYKSFSHVQTLTMVWNSFTPTKPGHSWTRSSQDVDILPHFENSEDGLEICIDLMSCCHIPLPAFGNILPEISLDNQLLMKNGCHIVLKSCESEKCIENDRECRLISYTKTEQECMRKINVRWKIIYKVLKWLFGYTDVLEIDTYKLKTAVLYCSFNAKPGDTITLDDGLIEVLEILRTSSCSQNLPGYFNPTLNIWSVSPCYHYLLKFEMIFLLKVFSNIQNIRTPKDENVALRQNIQIVNLWLSSFCSHSIEMSEMIGGMSSELFSFNWQGNIFLEILKEMEPTLKGHKTLAWIPFQMKCHVLLDVFTIILKLFIEKIANLFRLK